MVSKKMIALIAAGALAACVVLAGCGGQAASSSAASSSAASSAAASTAAASTSAAASSAAASAAASSAAASTPAASASAASTPAASSSAAAPAYIGEEAAKDIALKDAGFTAGDVTELKCELDFDAIPHYDVDFKQGGMEYDYDIDATTGAILQSHSEVDD